MFHPYTPTHDGSVKIWLLALLVLIVGIGTSICGVYTWQHRKVDSLTTQISQLQSDLDTIKKATPSPSVPRQTYTSTKGVSISLYTPISGSTVTSPCVIVGKVPGNWSFEASFPIVLKDSSGTAIGQTTGKLLDNWR